MGVNLLWLHAEAKDQRKVLARKKTTLQNVDKLASNDIDKFKAEEPPLAPSSTLNTDRGGVPTEKRLKISVAVVGCGHKGIFMRTPLLYAGYRVICTDAYASVVKKIAKGKTGIFKT